MIAPERKQFIEDRIKEGKQIDAILWIIALVFSVTFVVFVIIKDDLGAFLSIGTTIFMFAMHLLVDRKLKQFRKELNSN